MIGCQTVEKGRLWSSLKQDLGSGSTMGIRSRPRHTLALATDDSEFKGDGGLGGGTELYYAYGPMYVGRQVDRQP